MAWILVHSRPLPHAPLQAQTLPGPGSFFLRQTPFLSGGGRPSLPMPPHRHRPPVPHTYVWGQPPHSDLHRPQKHEQLLAQSPEMDDKLLLLHPHFHPSPRGLPPPNCLILQVQETLDRPQGRRRPPYANPAAARLPASFPSLSSFRAQDSSRHLTTGLASVYLPLHWRTMVPSPPQRRRLPVDALAHLTSPCRRASHTSRLSYTPPPPLGRTSPAGLHEKDLPGASRPSEEHAPSGLGLRCPHSLLLRVPSLPHPAPLHGPRKVPSGEDPPDASREELPSRTPLLVRRRPEPHLPPLRNRTRDLPPRHPLLPCPGKGP